MIISISTADKLKNRPDEERKVIFLDIDGVLHDDGDRRQEGEIICEAYVRNLKEIVSETNAEIILSSSWRYGLMHDAKIGFSKVDGHLSDLFSLFDKYQLQIAGITPLIYNGPYGRPLEIRMWLARRPEVSKFVILDDEDFWHWGWLQPFVVTTSWHKKVVKDGYHIEKRICGLEGKYRYNAIEILTRK